MTSPSVLITGASGFVGAHLSIDLAAAGCRVTAVGGRSPVSEEVSRIVATTFHGDLAEPVFVEALFEGRGYDAIVHCAAFAQVALCEKDPEGARRANESATQLLLDAASRKGAPRFLFISTDLMFEEGEAPAGGYRENDLTSPRTVYARSKAAGEALVSGYQGVGTTLRVSLVYGPPLGGRGSFLEWMRSAILKGESISLFRDEYRTPTEVGDIGRFVHTLITRKEPPRSRLYHLAGPDRLSRTEIGAKFVAILGSGDDLIVETSIATYAGSGYRARDASLCSARAIEEFGVHPCSFEDGLSRYFKVVRRCR